MIVPRIRVGSPTGPFSHKNIAIETNPVPGITHLGSPVFKPLTMTPAKRARGATILWALTYQASERAAPMLAKLKTCAGPSG
jgi:hypothetical protein